jgi:aminocarboxymuconate-semialdehyde decarboxylase
MDYLHEFYADTAMFGGGIHAIRCGLDFFGTDHVVFATDAPLGPIAPTIQVMSRLALEPHERRKLMVGNAEKLLKLNFTGATRR